MLPRQSPNKRQSVSDVNPNRPVDYWDRRLAHRPESTLSQFIGEHGMKTDSSSPGPRVVWMREVAFAMAENISFILTFLRKEACEISAGPLLPQRSWLTAKR